jgi:hypothetical protein
MLHKCVTTMTLVPTTKHCIPTMTMGHAGCLVPRKMQQTDMVGPIRCCSLIPKPEGHLKMEKSLIGLMET